MGSEAAFSPWACQRELLHGPRQNHEVSEEQGWEGAQASLTMLLFAYIGILFCHGNFSYFLLYSIHAA